MIEAQALSVRPPDGPAIADVTFTVLPGETLCLVGRPSGGQSTVADAFMNRVRPYRGAALIAGISCHDRPLRVRQLAAFVSPDQSWHLDLDARTNVALFAQLGGISARQLRPAVDDAMRIVGIADRHFSSRVSTLSPGVRCLLWLALARVRECPAILVHEPTLNVDEESWTLLVEAVQDLSSMGRATLVTTFDVAFAQRTGTRAITLQPGVSKPWSMPDTAQPPGAPLERERR